MFRKTYPAAVIPGGRKPEADTELVVKRTLTPAYRMGVNWCGIQYWMGTTGQATVNGNYPASWHQQCTACELLFRALGDVTATPFFLEEESYVPNKLQLHLWHLPVDGYQKGWPPGSCPMQPLESSCETSLREQICLGRVSNINEQT